jgi:hypothetical protein
MVTSATPPGPNGSTIRTGLSGNFASACETATPKHIVKAAAAIDITARERAVLFLDMAAPPTASVVA